MPKEHEADCGLNLPAAYAHYDRDMSSWRTSQRSLFGDSTECLETLPKRGMMRNGRLYELPTLERHIDGSDCSLWRTPKAGEGMGRYSQVNGKRYPALTHQAMQAGVQEWPTPTQGHETNKRYEQGGIHLSGAVKEWPTPHSNASTGAGSQGRDGGENLQTAAVNWPTPQASDGAKGGPNMRRGSGDQPLPGMVANWPTPATRDHKSGQASDATLNRNARPLNEVAVNWPTPKTDDGHSRSQQYYKRRQAAGREMDLQMQVGIEESSAPSPATPSGMIATISGRRMEHSGQLNPAFVCWLMGFPDGWLS